MYAIRSYYGEAGPGSGAEEERAKRGAFSVPAKIRSISAISRARAADRIAAEGYSATPRARASNRASWPRPGAAIRARSISAPSTPVAALKARSFRSRERNNFV